MEKKLEGAAGRAKKEEFQRFLIRKKRGTGGGKRKNIQNTCRRTMLSRSESEARAET